jgi:hypothetical protein
MSFSAKCPKPPEIRNAIISNITEHPNIVPSTDPDVYHIYTIATYECDENSTYVNGHKRKICTLNENWNGLDIQCQAEWGKLNEEWRDFSKVILLR